MTLISKAWIFVLLIIVCGGVRSSSDDKKNTPPHHPHQGKITPYQPGDPKVKLDSKALDTLNSGQPYQTQLSSKLGGRGMVVQDIHASADVVWGRILDYESYPEMVPKTLESTILGTETFRDGRKVILGHMKIGLMVGVTLSVFVRREWHPKLNSLTWTLDYSRASDMDDNCGYWYVIPHPDKDPTQWSRVYYSVEVSLFDWVPKFVVNLFRKQALVEATGWLKKHSELEFAKQSRREDADTAKKGKKKGESWFSKKKNKKGLNGTFSESVSDDSDDMWCTADDEEESCASLSLSKRRRHEIGYSRYLLVASVFGLGLYNVHLYFSR